MKLHTIRLKPGQKLRHEIEKFAHDNDIRAGFIITCVGSLTEANLRMAGASQENKKYRRYEGHFEIVSLVGTVSTSGCHLHMTISDSNGHVFGGHLTDDNIVGTTAEIVIGEDPDATYTREMDKDTGFPELVIKS